MVTMKKIKVVLLIGFIFSFSSCLTFYFIEPIPVDAKDYNSMPKEILGKWQTENETHTVDKTKWISEKIDSLGIIVVGTEYELSDSLVIKKSGKNYFFNVLEENGHWTLYHGYKDKNFFFVKGLNNSDTLTFFNSIGVRPDSIQSEKALFYNTRFSSKQMKKFVEAGGFADTVFLFDIKNRRIYNESFNTVMP